MAAPDPCARAARDLLAADSPTEAAAVALPALAAAAGRESVDLVVTPEGGSAVRYHLDPATRSVRSGPAQDGADGTADAAPGGHATFTVGELTVGFPGLPADAPAGAATLAAAIAARVSALCCRERSARDLRRSAQWLESLDGQLRLLERERQKFSMLVNKSEAGAVVFGPDHRVRWINRQVTEDFDIDDRARFLGSHCSVFCDGTADTPCDGCPVTRVLETRGVVHDERTRAARGETRHYYVSGFPLLSPGADVEEVLVTIQDLTDLRTLRRSEERYQQLFQQSTDGMVTATPDDFSILLVNAEARRLTGRGGDELSGCSLLELHPEGSRGTMDSFYRRVAEAGAPDTVEIEVEGAAGPRVCNVMASPFDQDGARVLLVEFRDVSQIRALQSELARADHLIALGTMNAGIAHEFKNRLAPLKAFAQMLEMPSIQPERVRRHAPAVVGEVDRLSALVSDILDYARPSDPRRRDVDLAGEVRLLLDDLRGEYGERFTEDGIACAVEVDAEADLCAHVDPDQVRRVLINLFRNAVDACEAGAGHRVAVRAFRRGGDAVLCVADTGRGVTAEHLERIFEPFFTTKGPRGTGLGMCIVQSLVEANGGVLLFESEPGRGTTVELVFPRGACRERAA